MINAVQSCNFIYHETGKKHIKNKWFLQKKDFQEEVIYLILP